MPASSDFAAAGRNFPVRGINWRFATLPRILDALIRIPPVLDEFRR